MDVETRGHASLLEAFPVTRRRLFCAAVLAVLLFALAVAHPARAQADTTRADATQRADTGQPTWLQDHSPRGALWRAAALPGWGQLYNRQYYKIPVVVAGLGAILYAAIDTNGRYLLLKRAHAYKRSVEAPGEIENPEQYQQFQPQYEQVLAQYGQQELSAQFLRRQRENLNRYRDLSFVGVGVVYALTVLDAYVSAHLLQFDVSEDLSLRAYPTPAGPAATLRVRF